MAAARQRRGPAVEPTAPSSAPPTPSIPATRDAPAIVDVALDIEQHHAARAAAAEAVAKHRIQLDAALRLLEAADRDCSLEELTALDPVAAAELRALWQTLEDAAHATLARARNGGHCERRSLTATTKRSAS